MAAPSTTAVVVTYNSRGTIDAALEAARLCHEAGELDVVVVDNRSSDGSLQYVRDNYPFVKAVDGGGNLGFGRGCNRGAEGVRTPYVIFINPDAIVPLQALRAMRKFMDEHPDAGVCAPFLGDQWVGLLTRPQDVLLAQLGRRPYPGRRQADAGEAPFRTTWVCGAVMMMRTPLFHSLGGFDPRFFLYFEETDLCRRSDEAGGQVWVVPEAIASHQAGASTKHTNETLYSGCIAEHYFQSRFYYLRKHHGLPAAMATELAEVALLTGRAAKQLARGGDGLQPLKVRLAGGLMRGPRRQ